MNRQDYLDRTQEQMPLARWEHTLRVVETAAILARRFDVDKEKVDTAAILHDFCKFWTAEELIFAIKQYKLPQDLLLYNQELWHGPVASVVATKELGIQDQDIKNAIFYHTTGKPNMGLVEKVVFLADYIEPARKMPGVEAVRLLAQNSLDEAIVLSLKQTIQFLISCGQRVYPLTYDTLRDLAKHENDI
ncbi:bis(5'-nucleosyl)-tetraphosphatase (symmetrical) YqeK [Shimazuella kribbensis]|uniref:bis(5'-nucleosyl)-tetraphosphatase (symmetrical) YqeK n=1 Tax=Shimazuella kribbensis TaxID=139808 RepID=UPI00040CB971|nr:bis(5'-nucleosyl)-tetraphosphatase (symmetrical) YqeK [Shimazuella kribbensis]